MSRMTLRMLSPILLLVGCGPKLFDVEAVVSFDNASGFDFVEAEVCGYTAAATTCTAPGEMLDGEGLDETLFFAVFDDGDISFDAYALDTDNDGYEQEFAAQVITGDETITIDVVMTLEHCCI